MKYDKQNGRLLLSQKKFIQKTVQKFDVTKHRPVSTPMEDKGRNDGAKTFKNQKQYQSIIGSLLYIANSTRPDVSFAVTSLSQHNGNPNEDDYKRACRVLRYLYDTRNLKLVFERSPDFKKMYAFSDASFARAIGGKSFTGSVVIVCRTAALWRCKKQSTVAQSAMQSEIIALNSTSRLMQWATNLIEEIKLTRMENQAKSS